MYLGDLRHHRLVDGQSARSIDDKHVAEPDPGIVYRGAGNLHRLLLGIAGEKLHTDLGSQGFELLDRRGAVNVCAHHSHGLLVTLLQQPRQLGNGSGLARALETGHQNHCGGLDRQIQPLVGTAHHGFEFSLDDFQECLARAQALHDFLAQCPLLPRLDKLLDDRQGDVGLQQRHADLAQRVLDIVFTQPGLAGYGTQAG